MQRQSAAFPRDSAGSAAFEEILALVARDRGAGPFENGFGPWTVRGGLQAALEKNRSFQGSFAAPRAASRCPGRPFPIGITTSAVRTARAGAPGGPPPSLRRAQRTPHRAPARPGAD